MPHARDDMRRMCVSSRGRLPQEPPCGDFFNLISGSITDPEATNFSGGGFGVG